MMEFPPDGQYVAKADETCNKIAKQFGLNAQEIVKLNKSRYPGLRLHAKLLSNTLIILPPPAAAEAPDGKATPRSGDAQVTGKRRRNQADASGNPMGLNLLSAGVPL